MLPNPFSSKARSRPSTPFASSAQSDDTASSTSDPLTFTLPEILTLALSANRGEWILCDDSDVTRVALSTLAHTLNGTRNTSHTPYLLFYTRIDPPDEYKQLAEEE